MKNQLIYSQVSKIGNNSTQNNTINMKLTHTLKRE